MTLAKPMDEHTETFASTHDALNRMRRAYERGTGCRLTAEMVQNLSLSVIGSMWDEDDPRTVDNTKEAGDV